MALSDRSVNILWLEIGNSLGCVVFPEGRDWEPKVTVAGCPAQPQPMVWLVQ